MKVIALLLVMLGVAFAVHTTKVTLVSKQNFGIRANLLAFSDYSSLTTAMRIVLELQQQLLILVLEPAPVLRSLMLVQIHTLCI
jgi:hypothetical protein